MKKKTSIIVLICSYIGLGVLIFFGSQWYVDKKDERLRDEIYNRFEHFFAKQDRFVYVQYHGEKVAYKQIPIPKYTEDEFSISKNKDKERWNERYGDMYKLYELTPKYTSEHSWDSDNKWSGWCSYVLVKDTYGGFSEYLIYPYQVAYKKQQEAWGYSYLPSIQSAVDDSYEFFSSNDLSDYKKDIVADRVDSYDVRGASGEYANDYYIIFSYDGWSKYSGGEEELKKSINNREYAGSIRYRPIDEREFDYCGGMHNGFYKVEYYRQPIAHWDITYNFFRDPKKEDRRRFIIWGEIILTILSIIFLTLIILQAKKETLRKEESLRDTLLRTCNPKNFLTPYDKVKVEVANRLYQKILGLSDADISTLKQIRKEAADNLGISFIDKKDLQLLIDKVNPKHFLSPYNAEKISLSNQLYPRLLAVKESNDIEEYESILEQAKTLLDIQV